MLSGLYKHTSQTLELDFRPALHKKRFSKGPCASSCALRILLAHCDGGNPPALVDDAQSLEAVHDRVRDLLEGGRCDGREL